MQNLKRSLLWQRHNVKARQYWKNKHTSHQRWSSRERPWSRGRFRGHILNSLASKPQVLKNCSVLSSRTALFFKPLKSCWKTPETSRKICEDLFLFCSSEDHLKKNFRRPFFYGEYLRLCLRSKALPSRGFVLGLGLGIFLCFWPWPRTSFLRLHLCFTPSNLYKVFKIIFNFL